MTRYYHLDPDLLGVSATYATDKPYVYGELISGWDDDENENIDFSIHRKDVRAVMEFLMEFIERHGDE